MQSFLNQLEMAHLTHKLPWTTLAEVVPLDRETRRHSKVREQFLAKKRYLAGCLADAVAEFAATDRCSEAGKEQYDVEAWSCTCCFDLSLRGAGAMMGFFPSVIWGYMELNLLAADEERMREVIFPTRYSGTLLRHSGQWDGSLPEYFNEKVRPLLDSDYDGRPVPLQGDAEAMQRVRDYCADLFRVMYTRPDLFTREMIFRYVEAFLYD